MSNFDLKIRRNRPTRILADQNRVLATYTLDSSYITPLELIGKKTLKTPDTRKVLPRGTVVALNPSTLMAVPNYTSYNFGELGVIIKDADCDTGPFVHDTEIEVVWRGDVMEKHLWDNGTFGTVLDATKTALVSRIAFVKETNKIRF